MTMQNVDLDLRKKVLDKFIGLIEAMAMRAESARRDAQARANEHAGMIESRFDTFREEAQYLTYGQGLRREELLRSLDLCRRLRDGLGENGEHPEMVRPGSVVRIVSETGDQRHYLLAHGGAGLRITVDAKEVVVASMTAPLARTLLNKEVGDEVSFPDAGKNPEEWVIDAVF